MRVSTPTSRTTAPSTTDVYKRQELARSFYAYLPQGLAGEPENRRVRRVAIPFAYLEYLVEHGEAERHEDGDGCFLYEATR